MSVGLDFEDEDTPEKKRKRQARLIASGWVLVKKSILGNEAIWKHTAKGFIQTESMAYEMQDVWDDKE